MRYIGGKSNLVEDIGNLISQSTSGVKKIIDIFSGSGVVASFFKNTPPVVDSPTLTEQTAPMKNEESDTIKFTPAQKAFLYSGDLFDADFASRLEFVFPNEFRYMQDDDSWMILRRNDKGGGVWKNGGGNKRVLSPFANKLSDALIANATPDSHQAVFGKHLKKQRNVSNALEMLTGISRLIIHPEDLNRHKNLLNVLNGVVDLKTGKFYSFNPDYLFTNQANAAFIPDVDTSFVEKFFASILPDEQTRRAVFRYLAYCLTGEKNYHVSEFWRGKGANGKSTALDTVKDVFGTYAKRLPASGILESRRLTDGNSATPAIAQLDGDVRLAIIDELPRNARIDSALFKTLTGDKSVYSRELYCSPRTIELRAKFIINGNHLPTFDVDDDGMLRRITNIPFTQSFKGNRADDKIAEKLSSPANHSALLKILVDEAKLFYREGLIESDEMKTAKDEYIAESDFVASFLIDNCITGKGGSITRKALEERIKASYPRECSRLKKHELLDQIISRLEPHEAFYTKDRSKRNIFKNVMWIEEYTAN